MKGQCVLSCVPPQWHKWHHIDIISMTRTCRQISTNNSFHSDNKAHQNPHSVSEDNWLRHRSPTLMFPHAPVIERIELLNRLSTLERLNIGLDALLREYGFAFYFFGLDHSLSLV